ncbi:aromatic acid/H+ symport family MFS transporter [Flexivirga sp. ID2601S]|uniref:Aromatic acid/H+ symport family MFS transporter n=1 Tax=Flexivirga aerilata TaxID=1656889 RepID=A0A849AL47_9MICO|nr:aromatic acid/H+ symport family MFS transporter [Flexivirga aerilata]NNG39110.1 aromatic acid/H+ symport family MFS transporter [Flexivirga aerilata]
MTQVTSGKRRSTLLVAVLCWSIVVFDGYDLIVYGTTIPKLLAEPGWGLTAGQAGTIGSLAFAGMLVGALGAGVLADRLGRRRMILACTAWFSVFTTLCAFAGGPTSFGILRFVAGIGLGGLVPTANALTAEFVGKGRRALIATAMMSGVPIGGSIAALLGLWAMPTIEWRGMYAVAALALVVLLPAAAVLLPESPAWLRVHGRPEQAHRIEQEFGLTGEADPVGTGHVAPLSAVLRPPYLVASVLFACATIATLFAWYGLGTWLPKLMGPDGRFDLGDPLTFLLALNLGAVAGSALTAWAGDRFGPLRSAAVAALAAAAGLAFLLTYPSSAVPVYAALVIAGIGTHGTQCLIIAAITNRYPAVARGTALGFALGAGRVGAIVAPQAGGWLIDGGYGVGGNIAMFAAASALAAALLAVTTRTVRAASAPRKQLDSVVAH